MLTQREAFKVGFLRKCSEAGFTEEETVAAIKEATELVKKAALQDFLTKPYETGLGILGNVGSTAGQLGIGAAMLGPAALGASAGLGLASMGDVDDTDVQAIKKREIIDEYRRQVELLKGKRKGVYQRHKSGPV